METQTKKVLILDDERHCQEKAKDVIKLNSNFFAITPDVIEICRAVERGNFIAFVDSLMKKHEPDIVLTDIQFLNDDSAGFNVASHISKDYPSVKVIGMTSSAYSYIKEVEDSKMFKLLNKEWCFDSELLNALDNCV